MERKKTKRQMQKVASIDRLSGLSDDILTHILSFLPTKLSVSTGILAKRWRFMWAHVPSLHFEGEITSLDVIHRVMALQKSKNMDTFSLSDIPHLNEYQLETLIITAIDHRNVRKLRLCRFKVVLPRCLFTSETLVDLRLDECVGILPAGGSPAYLPSLKRLYLHGLTYLVEDALPGLLSGFPVLEELSIIKGTVGPDLCCFDISSPSIKRLEIDLQIFKYKTFLKVSVLKINAPTLWYLKLHADCDNLQLSLSPMPSLIEADMCLFRCDLSTGKLFDWFPNIKCLKLGSLCCKFLGATVAVGSVVKFDCLTELQLSTFSVDWDELVKFLEIANKLQVLSTYQVNHNYSKSMGLIRKDRFIPSLKTITIHGFGCSKHELNMVKYFLRNAQVLKRMEIYSRSSSGVDLEANLTRSRDCRV